MDTRTEIKPLAALSQVTPLTTGVEEGRLVRVIEVGKHGTIKEVSPTEIESLRPSKEEMKHG